MSSLKRGVIALLVAAVAFVGAVTVPSARASGTTAGCIPSIGKRVPVEFVHGLLGKPSDWTSMEASLKSVPDLYLDTPFDYSQHNTEWVNNPAIGPVLAQRIACLATSSRQAGGPGKVILVVHSIGGLAVRWAATESSNAAEVANDLGLVVTIGTPNLGSGWATIGAGLLDAICTPATLSGQPSASPGSFCASWSALAGLQDDSQQIKSLPWLPSKVPVYAIAGDVTVNIPLFLATDSTNAEGDLVVSEHSALQGVSGAGVSGYDVVPCIMNLPALVVSHTGPSCWHSALPHNYSVEQQTATVIRKYLATTAGISATYVGKWLSPDAGIELAINADGSARLTWGNSGSSEVAFHAISGGIDGVITSTTQPHLAFTPGRQITLTPAPYGGLAMDPHGAADPTVVYKETALSASALAPYVGAHWYVHGATLAVKPDSTGTMTWNAGPCGSEICSGTATIMFDATSGNGIIGIITYDNFTQSDGQPAPPDFTVNYGDPQPGYVFKLQVAGPKQLYTTWLGQPAASLNSGNRNWCWTGNSYPVGTCGA